MSSSEAECVGEEGALCNTGTMQQRYLFLCRANKRAPLRVVKLASYCFLQNVVKLYLSYVRFLSDIFPALTMVSKF
jgi:hypothetical protein